ncbi:MAG: ribosome-associated protein [bacterium]|jgi:ribosome-associated protein
MQEIFSLDREYIELIKLLKVVAFCQSGGEAKAVVGEGLVKVDGEVEFRKKCKIRKGQIIEFEGNTIQVQ